MFQAAEVEPGETAAVSEITEELRARSREIFASRSDQITTKDPWWRSIFQHALAHSCSIDGSGIARRCRHRTPAPAECAAPALHPVSDAGQHIMRSTAVVVVAPVGDLRTTPTRVEWRAVPGAAKYRVRLLEVDRNELWAAETDEVHMDLPVAVQARIVPGNRFCAKSALSATLALRLGNPSWSAFEFYKIFTRIERIRRHQGCNPGRKSHDAQIYFCNCPSSLWIQLSSIRGWWWRSADFHQDP